MIQKSSDLDTLISIVHSSKRNMKNRNSDVANFLKHIPRVPHNHKSRSKLVFPLKIVLDVNSNCNLKCKMCYVKKRDNSQISYSKIISILREIKKNKSGSIISYSSLEPFLRKDFLKIIEKTHELNIPYSIFTNGTLINKKTAKALVKYNPISISFSLHGLRETHEMINNTPGSYDKTINAIKNINYYKKLFKKQLPFIRVNCVISRFNYQELPKIFDFGRKLKLNLRFSHLIWEKDKTHSKIASYMKEKLNTESKDIRINFSNKFSNGIDMKNLIANLKIIKEKDKKVQFLPNLNTSEIKKWYKSPIFFKEKRCFYPFESINIRADGEVHPCAFIDFSYGNILHGNIKQIWSSEPATFFKDLLKKNGVLPPCNKCCKL